jgi:thiosulfate/3-mercaptopyruvate sulfurtransferase
MMTWRSTLGMPLVVAALAAAAAACSGGSSGSASSAEPWGTNTVKPADLVSELAGASGADKPVVVCTAPPFLYRAGRIPGAVLHGPMTSPTAIDELTAWAQPLPRSTDLVIYCGCCPMDQCPNIRPAYKLLKDLGFTRVRVLALPTSFATDWLGHGYPVEK